MLPNAAEMSKKGGIKIDIPLCSKNVYDDDALVIVLGKTGSGRSTFINNAMGRDVAPVAQAIRPQTVSISHFFTNHPEYPDRRFILVDTPGFDAELWENYDVLQRLVKWLKRSLPPMSSRKVAVIYLLEIDQHLSHKEELQVLPGKLCIHGIAENLVLATTKWSHLTASDVERHRERHASEPCRGKIHSFHDTRESAWEIIDTVAERLVNITEFQDNLASVLPTPQSRWTAFLTRLFPSWVLHFIGIDSNNTGARRASPASFTKHVETRGTDVLARLEAVGERLKITFGRHEEYQRLLSCKGSEAQSLLDTFQLILRNKSTDRRCQRNLILATKRLSSQADLYPSSFLLSDVQRLHVQPVTSGGYADIYEGIFQGEHVCLKTVRVYQTSSYQYILKIIAQEAVEWGQLSHPNLLPLYGLHWFGRQLSLVYPWARNGNVVDFVKAHPSADRALLCSDVAEGIAYLHDNDIVHGHLKGTRILVDGSCRAYLTDFGVSAVTDPEILNWSSQSIVPSSTGAVRWQAPELLELEYKDGFERAVNTKASDVYAWSCICYQTLTGRVPFFEYFRDHVVMGKVSAGTRPTRPVGSEEWGLTDHIWTLLNDCWERDVVKRPNIAEILSRLADVRAEDHRPPREWKVRPAILSERTKESSAPLSLSSLEAILGRGAPE